MTRGMDARSMCLRPVSEAVPALLGQDAELLKRCEALDVALAVITQVLDAGTAIRAAYDLLSAWKKGVAAHRGGGRRWDRDVLRRGAGAHRSDSG